MKRLLAVAVLSLLLSACAEMPCDVGQCPLPTASTQNFDDQVHDYLTRHPEVLMEMSQALARKRQEAMASQAKDAIAKHRAELFANPEDGSAGNPKGDVTIVLFFDAECPFCKKAAPDIGRLIATDRNLRVVYKEFPILGPMSVTAAKAALASSRQGKYGAFHDALMADRTAEHQLTEAHLFEIASSVGINLARLKSDMASESIAAHVTADIAFADKIGIRSTPSMIIGDKLIPGAMSYEQLTQAVAHARKSGS